MKSILFLILSIALAKGADKPPNTVFILAAGKPELTAKLHAQLKQWPTENAAPRCWPRRGESVSPEAAAKPFPFRGLR